VNMIERREKLKAQLKDKKYRDAFVSEHIDTGIPFQIRALRKQREWTQKELSDRTGMAQERISVAENPNYSRFNLKTLKRIAYTFDVALIVRFVPISELVKWELNLSSETLEAVSFDEDPYFKPPITTIVAQGGLVLGGEGIAKVLYPSQTPGVPNLDYHRMIRQQSKKEMKSQLPKFMVGEQDNETAFG